MAPFFEAVKVEYGGTTQDGAVVFNGTMDDQWANGEVPHGGYVLALILEACIHFQARVRPDHPDPLNVTIHYVQRTSISDFEVRVKNVKSGRSFTNLTAELVQKNQVNVTAHLIFGSLTVVPDAEEKLTIEPPSPFARRIPIHHHPSQGSPSKSRWKTKYDFQMKISEDGPTFDRNKPENKAKMFSEVNSGPRGSLERLGGGGIEIAQWLELLGNETDRIRPSLIGLFVDMAPAFPAILPGKAVNAWHPTMSLTVQFFSPIPPASSPDHATRTVGIYGTSKFMIDPHGRHDANVEVWTAPTNIGEGEIREGWRDKQVCLASATQMALSMPFTLTRDKPKL